MTSPNPKTSHTKSVAKPIPPPNFDTMSAMRMLTKAGFTQDQASAIVGTVRDAQRELATKADLDQAVGELKADLDLAFSELKADSDLAFSELKADLGLVFSELKADSDLAFSELKADLGLAFNGLKADSDLALSGLRADSGLAFSGLRAEMEAMKFSLQKNLEEQDSKVERQFTQLYRHLWIGTGMTITAITSILGMMIVFSGG